MSTKKTPKKPPVLKPGDEVFPIVGIGASAGGLEALQNLLEGLSVDAGAAYVVVQHLDPAHESALTDILRRATAMPVAEAADKLTVQPNHVYVIPPNVEMTIEHGCLRLQPRAQSGGATHSIDRFFQSLAKDCQQCAIGVILSGTANDGTMGLEAIKEEGGITIAQDESARYTSMPRSAIQAGCVDFVLPPQAIAEELERIAKHPHVRGTKSEGGEPDEIPLVLPRARSRHGKQSDEQPRTDENSSNRILLLLRNHSGVDFSLYKPTTIQRRIARRMVLHEVETLEAYADCLQEDVKELDALYSDLLINVTSFFRNPEAFDELQREVFPKLLQNRKRADRIRVWVLGCSTGQEAYSIAMAYLEFSEKIPQAPQLQIFATDLNEVLLDKARQGFYAKGLVHDVAPERLRRFFVEEEGGYRVTKPLRDLCIFARQNLLSDPPFSRMDLISCRNLLIYLEPALQNKILPTLHYALKPEGFLFLGASESVGPFADLFRAVNKKLRIFSRKVGKSQWRLPVSESFPSGRKQSSPAEKESRRPAVAEANIQREADRVAGHRFAPPGVLINSDLQILQFRGATREYLEPAAGKASFDLLKMARRYLTMPLRSAVEKAKAEQATVRVNKIATGSGPAAKKVNLEVIPLKNLKEPCFLVFFEESETSVSATRATATAPQARAGRRDDKEGGASVKIRNVELERELTETRDYVESMQERYEAAIEELQSSNEEVTSANEELQSLNEELETSKEELESTNEELTTVNEEMANRNQELLQLNADLNNLHTSIQTPILMLGRDLTIRRFTPFAQKIFNLLAADVGRPLGGIRHNLDFAELESFISETVASISPREREVRDRAGNWYVLRVRPYLTLDGRIDGAVVMLLDINQLKQTEEKITGMRDFAQAVVEAVPPLLILESNLRVRTANASFYAAFKVSPQQTEHRLVYELGNGQWNIPGLRKLLEEVLPLDSAFRQYELTHDFESIGRRTMLLSGCKVDSMNLIVLSFEDITVRKEAEEAIRHANTALSSLSENLDRQVRERTASLQEAVNELLHFSYTITHDMRAPLRAMAGFSELLLAEGEALSETKQIYATRICEAAKRMDKLIIDALDYAKLARDDVPITSVDVNTLLQGMVASYPDYQPPAVLISIAKDMPAVLANEAGLTQCFSNLFDNAVKFAQAGKAPEIRIWAEERKRGEEPVVRFWVEDNGIGISAEYQEKIFAMFQKISIAYEGTGVGLALVRKAAARMNGLVGVESELGKGSRFWLEFNKAP